MGQATVYTMEAVLEMFARKDLSDPATIEALRQYLSVKWKGPWNATTNIPHLEDGTGEEGDYYQTSVSGVHDFGHGSITFAVNDFAVYDQGMWTRVQVTPLHLVDPWQINLDPTLPVFQSNAWSTNIANAACLNNGYNVTYTNGAFLKWRTDLPGGQWYLDLMYVANTDCGIAAIYVDDGFIANVDMYASTLNGKAVSTVDLGSLSRGPHDVMVRIEGKNGSSSNTGGYLVKAQLRRGS